MKVVPRTIIKAARAMLSWTQKDLADAVGADMTVIARFESGAGMRDETMDRIIDQFQENGLQIEFRDDVAVGVRFTAVENHTPR